MNASFSSFLNPKSVAVVGVSSNTKKLGTVILKNIVEGKYRGKIFGVNPKYKNSIIAGQPVLAKVSDYSTGFDLVIIVVPAPFVEKILNDCVKNKTKNVIIISAGFKEIGEAALEKKIARKCEKNEINLLGPNCLGAIFPHKNLNASFSDGMPKKGNIAFVSQSGAFCTAALDWANQKQIGFSHFFSLGNKAGISEIELLETLALDPKVKVFALYLESLRNGVQFLETLRKISPKKPIIILEPGRSAAARKAASSHTGALAPNAKIIEEAYREAGVVQVFSMQQTFQVLELLEFSGNKNFGPNVAVITNAGGVGVLTSDLLAESSLCLSEISNSVQKKLQKKLPATAGLHNPIDIIGDANADRYKDALEVFLNDKNTDQILVLLTPQRTTEIRKTAEIIAKIHASSEKNIVPVFVGGQKIDEAAMFFRACAIPFFKFPSAAVTAMSLIASAKARVLRKPQKTGIKQIISADKKTKIRANIRQAQKKGFRILSEEISEEILKIYKIKSPASKSFHSSQQKLAKVFAQSLLGKHKLVLKIVSPFAAHKTELKAVRLNIDSLQKFEKAWESLTETIVSSGILDAKIQLQQQIEGGQELILGMHTDPNFGKILIFGRGGIYTEVFADTVIRILPTTDFDAMIQETKVGAIIEGVRGQNPLKKDELIAVLKSLQYIVQDFPEISSVDINPAFLSEKECLVVDFKVYI